MSIERARAHLEKYGVADRIQEFDVSSATVELAAQALGCEGARIAKSLSFIVDGRPVLVLAAGDAKVDNQKFKAFFHTKAKMPHGAQVEELIGHGIGGVCPFGVNEGVEVYLDVSMKRFEVMYPACGSSSSAIGLTLEELERCSQAAGWIDVCKDWK